MRRMVSIKLEWKLSETTKLCFQSQLNPENVHLMEKETSRCGDVAYTLKAVVMLTYEYEWI